MTSRSLPTVDPTQLEMMTGGDAELAAEALDIFRNQAEAWGRLLDPAGDPIAWSDACHAIKGSARSVGALALGEACDQAEALGRSGSVGRTQASVALGEVRERMADAIEALADLQHRLRLHRAFPRSRR